MVDVDDVLGALDHVVDPCSNAMGLPLGLRDMGLVAAVEVDERHVAVRLRLTSPCCAYGPVLAAAAVEEVRRLPHVPTDVRVTVDHTATWTPADMSPAAGDALARRRDRTVHLAGVRPHDWSSWR